MQKRGSLIALFLVFFIASLTLFIFSKNGALGGVTGILESFLIPIKRITFQKFHNTYNLSPEEKLRDENAILTAKLAKNQELEKENVALRDQFHTTIITSQSLIPASIIGLSGFFPGNTFPDSLTVDQGTKNGVIVGDIVVYKDNLLGKVVRTEQYLSVIDLIESKHISLTAVTSSSSAIGIVRGLGNGQMVFDNVVLSDLIKINDIVVTKGDSDKSYGYPPNFVVGKIVSVNKKASALFQQGQLVSFVDPTKLSMVFIIIKQR